MQTLCKSCRYSWLTPSTVPASSRTSLPAALTVDNLAAAEHARKPKAARTPKLPKPAPADGLNAASLARAALERATAESIAREALERAARETAYRLEHAAAESLAREALERAALERAAGNGDRDASPPDPPDERLFLSKPTGGRACRRRRLRRRALALLKHPDDPSCTFSDRAAYLAANLRTREYVSWLTAAELADKASAREYTISLRRSKRFEDFDRTILEHWELVVAHVASHGGADFRPTTQLNKAGARARRLQEGGNHPSRTARAARRTRRLDVFAAAVHLEQHGSIGSVEEEEADEAASVLGFSTVTAAAEDPKPSSTTTSPATTDAQRLELKRRIGLLDLEIDDLDLKGGRDSIALEIDVITRSRTALVEERRACNVFDMAEIFPFDRKVGFLDLHLESLRLKDLMIRKERADETTRSIDALSRSRTALVTALWALSLFDFIDRSGPAIPGEFLDVVISSHPYGLPEFGDDLLQRFAGRYGSRGRKIYFHCRSFLIPGCPLSDDHDIWDGP